MMTFSKFVMIILSASIMVRCIRSMLREKYEPETWAYLRVGRETLPVRHWENLIGRSRSADIRLDLEKISRVHAVLSRNGAIRSRGTIPRQSPAGQPSTPM